MGRLPRASDKAAQAFTKSLGARIRALREQVGLTQEKLAYEAGLNKSYLSMLEKGIRGVSIASVMLIAERLGVEPLDLFVFPAKNQRHRLIDATREARLLRRVMRALQRTEKE